MLKYSYLSSCTTVRAGFLLVTLNSYLANKWPSLRQRRQSKEPEDILSDFQSSHPQQLLLHHLQHRRRPRIHFHWLFSSLVEMYCMFVGSSSNLSLLLWQCGLCDKLINEAMLVIACQSKSSRISRDPLHSFVYDNKAGF